METRKLTGFHVLGIFVGGFGIIIAVNVFMAVNAVRTFPGLEVSSSYADSQTFNSRRAQQDALGWEADAVIEDGVLTLSLTHADGSAVYPAEFEALLTRATTQTNDQSLVLERGADGRLSAPVEVTPGLWRLRMTGVAMDGTEYRHNLTIRVRS